MADESIGYRRVVLPLDGSALAELALPHAEALARLTGAPLHLVRVIDPLDLGEAETAALFAGVGAFQQLLENERIAAREYLKRIGQDLRNRLPVVTVQSRQGRAAQELVALARPGDVLVMATHGRGGVARWFLGSVAEDVVRRATVPVLLVRAAPSEPDNPVGGAAG